MINSHCTVMLIISVSSPTLLLAEHMYSPASSLETFVIVKFTLTLITFPYPVGALTLSLTDTLSLKFPSSLLHTTVGGGYPNASHVIMAVFLSLTVLLIKGLTVAIPT